MVASILEKFGFATSQALSGVKYVNYSLAHLCRCILRVRHPLAAPIISKCLWVAPFPPNTWQFMCEVWPLRVTTAIANMLIIWNLVCIAISPKFAGFARFHYASFRKPNSAIQPRPQSFVRCGSASAARLILGVRTGWCRPCRRTRCRPR